MSITNETIKEAFAKALGAPQSIVKVESATKYWACYDVGDEIVKVSIGDSYITMIFNALAQVRDMPVDEFNKEYTAGAALRLLEFIAESSNV